MDADLFASIIERYGFIVGFFAILFGCTLLLEKAEQLFSNKLDGMDVVLRRRWVLVRLVGAAATALACLAVTLFRA